MMEYWMRTNDENLVMYIGEEGEILLLDRKYYNLPTEFNLVNTLKPSVLKEARQIAESWGVELVEENMAVTRDLML